MTAPLERPHPARRGRRRGATVALVADEVGDRCGVVAFDDEIRRRLPPRRAAATPSSARSSTSSRGPSTADYELAFRTVGGAKRALIVVFTDLVDEAAARPLVDAVPVLARRHVVRRRVACAIPTSTPARAPSRRRRATSTGRRSRSTCSTRAPASRPGCGAPGRACWRRPPARCAEACVRAYLRVKARARLAVCARPRQTTSPRTRTEPDADDDAPPRPRPEPVTKPSTSRRARATASCRARISTAARASRRSDWPRVSVPGSMSAQPMRSPAGAATAMHRARARRARGRVRRVGDRCRLDGEAEDRADEAPLKISTAAVPSPARCRPRTPGTSTRMLLVKISLDSAAWSPPLSVPPRAARLGRVLERAGHDADRRARIVDRPYRASTSGPNRQTSAATSADGRSRMRRQYPVARNPPRDAAACVGVDGLARVERRAARAAASAGRAGKRGARTRGRRRRRDRAPPRRRSRPGRAARACSRARGAAPRARSSRRRVPPRNGLAFTGRWSMRTGSRIATPEGVDVELTLAGIGSRFIAAIFDFVIQGSVCSAPRSRSACSAAARGGSARRLRDRLLPRLLRLRRAVRGPLARAHARQALDRAAGRAHRRAAGDVRPELRAQHHARHRLPAGHVRDRDDSIFVTSRNQRLGDLAAGTLVVRERPAA